MRYKYAFFSLFNAICTMAQVSISVQTEKGRKEFSENEPIIINVLLEVSGKNMVQQTPLRIFSTSKFEVLGSGSEQNTFIDEKTGYFVNQTHYQTVLRAKKMGKYKIGSASVVVNDKLYYTEPFEISINETSFAPINKQEVMLRLSVDNPTPFEREKVIATVTAYSKNIEILQRLKKPVIPPSPQFVIVESNQTKQEIEQKDEINTQVIAIFSLIPEIAGTIKIKPVSIEVSSSNSSLKNLFSNSITLQVKPLPKDKPQHFSNSVGDFQLRINTPKTVEQGKLFPIEITLEGTGNLDKNILPKLQSSKLYTTYTPKILSEEKGESGKNIYRIEYMVLPRKAGKLNLETEKYIYFSSEEKKYIELAPQSSWVEVKTPIIPPKEHTPDNETKKYTQLIFPKEQSTPINTSQNTLSPPSKTIFWTLLGGATFSFIGIFFLYSRRKSNLKHTNTPQANIYHLFVDSLDTMNMAITQGQFSIFFSEFFMLEKKMKNAFSVKSEQELFTYLEKHYGRIVMEKYQNIQQTIKIESNAPQHQPTHLYELTNVLKEVATYFH